MGHREEWIINGEKIILEDVIEVYKPTKADEREVEKYRKIARQKTFSNKERKYFLVRKYRKSRKGDNNK